MTDKNPVNTKIKRKEKIKSHTGIPVKRRHSSVRADRWTDYIRLDSECVREKKNTQPSCRKLAAVARV